MGNEGIKESSKKELKTHKDLVIWQKSIDLVENVYALTKNFPREEMFALASQMRRAAVSIPSNIAEGAARQSNKEFIQFLYVALGSLSELETQCIISNRLGFIKDENIVNAIEVIRRQLLKFIKFRKGRSK